MVTRSVKINMINMKNNIDYEYLDLLQDIMKNGIQKGDRTGTGTKSVFGRQITHDMSLGFPLLTTKKVAFNRVKTELQWFLDGNTDIRFLWKYKCHIWDGDFYKKYIKDCKNNKITPLSLEELRNVGVESLKHHKDLNKNESYSLGPIYGAQWRNWHNDDLISHAKVYIDQIETLKETLRTNPDSRRMIVNAWNVGKLNKMTLPPCHDSFQIYTRELTEGEKNQWVMKNTDVEWENLYIYEEACKETTPKREISLIWRQRSVDVPLGLPFNIASYGLLLTMLASEFNMVPGELIGHLGDCHIYNNQFDGVKEQLKRTPKQLPKVFVRDGMKTILTGKNEVLIEGYDPHDKINFPLSN